MEERKLRKRSRLIALALTLVLASSCFTNVASAKTTTKTVTATRTVKSWCGIPVYSIGVKGDYTTDGKKLSNQKNARAVNDTYYPGWRCTSKTAKWVSKGKTSSTVRNNSTFKYGLDTMWVKVNIQSYQEELNATVKP